MGYLQGIIQICDTLGKVYVCFFAVVDIPKS